MVEICLNPDNTTLGGEVFESVDSDVHAESRDSQEMALRTADKLLKELKPKGGQQQMSFQLLQGMLQLATKNKVNTEHDPLKLKCFLSFIFAKSHFQSKWFLKYLLTFKHSCRVK